MRILKSGLAAAAALSVLGLGSQLQAETINVDGLVNLGGSAGNAQWKYTTDMTATGAADSTQDNFNILNVLGFLNFDATHATAKDFTDHAGNTWHASATPGAPGTTTISVEYTSSPTVEFGANLANSFGNLVDITFNDLYTADGAGANWTSQDHGATDSSTTGLALTGLSEASAGVIDTPVPSTGVPLPASAWGGMALLGLLAVRRKSSKTLV